MSDQVRVKIRIGPDRLDVRGPEGLANKLFEDFKSVVIGRRFIFASTEVLQWFYEALRKCALFHTKSPESIQVLIFARFEWYLDKVIQCGRHENGNWPDWSEYDYSDRIEWYIGTIEKCLESRWDSGTLVDKLVWAYGLKLLLISIGCDPWRRVTESARKPGWKRTKWGETIPDPPDPPFDSPTSPAPILPPNNDGGGSEVGAKGSPCGDVDHGHFACIDGRLHECTGGEFSPVYYEADDPRGLC